MDAVPQEQLRLQLQWSSNCRKPSRERRSKKAGLIPKAFHVVLAKSLYHDPVEEVISMGLFSSPEHADKKSVSFNVLRYKR